MKSCRLVLSCKRMLNGQDACVLRQLSCELTVNTKKAGKRLDPKLTNDFAALVKSCKMAD